MMSDAITGLFATTYLARHFRHTSAKRHCSAGSVTSAGISASSNQPIWPSPLASRPKGRGLAKWQPRLASGAKMARHKPHHLSKAKH